MKRTWLTVSVVVLLVSVLVLFGLAFSIGRWERLGGSKVALITVEGVILDSKEVIRQLEKYRKNPSVKAIVLRINSPGGGVAPSQEIYEEILRTRQINKIPIVTSVGDLAASGGYYIASATDRIVANPGSIIGSIGVLLQVPNVSGLLQKIGVKSVVVKSGQYKDMTSPAREMTDAERQLLQEMLDDVHNQFIDVVTKGRQIERKKVEAIADGRIFSGRQAQSLGLVDQLGNLRDAIEQAGTLGGIRGKPTVIREQERKSFLLELLRGDLNLFDVDFLIHPSSTLSVKYLLW